MEVAIKAQGVLLTMNWLFKGGNMNIEFRKNGAIVVVECFSGYQEALDEAFKQAEGKIFVSTVDHFFGKSWSEVERNDALDAVKEWARYERKLGYKRQKIFLGSSDIASLTIRHPEGSEVLEFREDASYYAWLVDENVDIPSHYKKVFSFHGWIKVYDDDSLVQEIEGREIEIYRAGERGCLVRVIK